MSGLNRSLSKLYLCGKFLRQHGAQILMDYRRERSNDEGSVNLIPWRSRAYLKRRRCRGIVILIFAAVCLIGSVGLERYFLYTTQKFKQEDQDISAGLSRTSQTKTEAEQLRHWKAVAQEETQGTEIFLRIVQSAALFSLHLNGASLDFSGPKGLNFSGLAQAQNLYAWLESNNAKLSQQPIVLFDVRKSFDQVEFQAKVSWGGRE